MSKYNLKQFDSDWMKLDDFERLPGLFRRWEILKVLETSREFVIEEVGTASDGTILFAIYRRKQSNEEY